MLAQDLRAFGLRIYFMIGALLCAGATLLILVGLYMAFKIWLSERRQKHSYAEYYARTRRADGKMYPPRSGGICELCGRVRTVVYHLPTHEHICADCYEPHWRRQEGWVDPPEPERPTWRTLVRRLRGCHERSSET